MNRSPARVTRLLAALAGAGLLAACSTSVAGVGHPAAAGSGGSGGFGSPSGQSSGSGSFDAGGDAHDVWSRAIDATSSTGGSVLVGGIISGAGIGGARIKAQFSTDDDGDPVADVDIVTPKGGALQVTSTGGQAWAKADAAVYEEYGYDATGSEQAAGKEVELTDDDSGLDVYADLTSFLDLCGPSDDDPASIDTGSYAGRDAVVVDDEKYGTKTYLDPATGRVFASVYRDETVLFTYQDEPTTVDPPDDSEVVTVDGF